MNKKKKFHSERVVLILVGALILVLFIQKTLDLKTEKDGQKGFLTLVFDDGLKSQYEIAFKEMRKYGYNGTLFLLANQTEYFEGRKLMNFDNAKEMQKSGWEIGSHGMTHEFINDTNLEYQIIESKKVLALNNFSVSSFCCPYGCNESLQKIRKISEDIYQTTLSLDWGENNLSLINPKRLKSKWVNNTNTAEDICNWVRKAKKEDNWLILRFHGITESEKPAHKYDFSLENFKKILNCIKKTDMQIKTIKEVFRQ